MKINDEARELLQTALHMQVRVDYATIELVIEELRWRRDLRTVAIKFCDKLDRGTLEATIEPFKKFREIDMSGSTSSLVKRFSIERVGTEWDPHCDLFRDIPKPRTHPDFLLYWNLISEVVEGRRTVDYLFTDNMFKSRDHPRKPRISPWF